ncbi:MULTISPECIES: class I SAM-dependent methyltransferase [Paenibacillus]|uniref:YxbB n=1 Tax=Paenibacillus polymyxa (strain SC2) TaxID=886882 RepID=E3EC81_PAEPS|nr:MULTISPECIES: class I SAM-dependent methyltransferase [Paenibacillus]KAF6627791.1 methyltransferase domain-containing protein [Paenibacillus sp. EKM208P]ADO54224.1 yxbB [Paenibacillus polymyxa SC2]MCP3780909.1 methyltransferase domain-containing protein [Paenibacillus sp. MZ03-122A]WPQ57147.1 class I SAM-dependent methyltransferase [Paenibacillus polymyxa]CCC83154.1 methyltransferase type 11 [Paenibacillus polymyxa M1]
MITAEECQTYNKFIKKYQPHLYPLLGAHISRLYERKGGVVIDMGTGPGYLTVELAERLKANVHAVDINPAMHDLARRLVEERGLSKSVHFDVIDVHNQIYPDNYADLVVSYSCLHHWENPVRALLECYRVLSPNGLLIIIDTLPNNKDTLNALKRSIPEPEYFRFIREAFEESYSMSKIEEMIHEAGIVDFELNLFKFNEEDIADCIEVLEDLHIPEVEAEANTENWILTACKK